MAQETEGSQANDTNMSTIRNSPPIIVAKCTVEQAPRRMPLALLDALVIALCASTQLCEVWTHDDGECAVYYDTVVRLEG